MGCLFYLASGHTEGVKERETECIIESELANELEGVSLFACVSAYVKYEMFHCFRVTSGGMDTERESVCVCEREREGVSETQQCKPFPINLSFIELKCGIRQLHYVPHYLTLKQTKKQCCKTFFCSN